MTAPSFEPPAVQDRAITSEQDVQLPPQQDRGDRLVRDEVQAAQEEQLRAKLAAVEVAGRRLSVALWVAIFGVMVLTAVGVTTFLIEHKVPEQVAWMGDPLAGGILVIVLQGDAVLTRYSRDVPRWSVVVRILAGGATWGMNTWQSAAAADLAGIFVHSVFPLLLIGASEVVSAYRKEFAEFGAAVRAELDQLAVQARARAQEAVNADATVRAQEAAARTEETRRAAEIERDRVAAEAAARAEEAAARTEQARLAAEIERDRIAAEREQAAAIRAQADADAARIAAEADAARARIAAELETTRIRTAADAERARADADRATAETEQARIAADERRRQDQSEERERRRQDRSTGGARTSTRTSPGTTAGTTSGTTGRTGAATSGRTTAGNGSGTTAGTSTSTGKTLALSAEQVLARARELDEECRRVTGAPITRRRLQAALTIGSDRAQALLVQLAPVPRTGDADGLGLPAVTGPDGGPDAGPAPGPAAVDDPGDTAAGGAR